VGSRSFTTEALVIGSMRYREADRIVTLYTRDRGRLGALAKGVRRLSSKVGGRLEPFSLVRVSLHPGRGLYTVVGVDTVRTFQSVRDELFRMQEGARLLSWVRRLFPQEESNPAVFNLLVRAVALLAAADVEGAAKVVLATRLKLLALLGYAPDLGGCVVCGRSAGLFGYSPARGGLVCDTCLSAGEEGFGLSGAALASLRELMARPLAEIENIPLEPATAAEVEQVLTQTLAYHGH